MISFFKKYTVYILLAFTLCVGLLTFKNYGIGWDELDQRELGMATYKYVFEGNQELTTLITRDHGVAFEMPLTVIEKVFGMTDTRTIYLMRHLVTHLFFLTGAFFLFLLIDFQYKNKLLAAFGFLLLVLSPRIYTHSFFNSKDIPFLSMMLICFYLTAFAFSKKSIKRFIVLGIGTGLLINLRMMGALLFCCIFICLLIDIFLQRNDVRQMKKNILILCVFIFVAVFSLYLTWPFLWENPVQNFLFAFKNMCRFPWGDRVLFHGVLVPSTEIRWSYGIEWFAMTTPIAYVTAGIAGICLLAINVIKRPLRFLKNNPDRINLIFLCCFLIPFVFVIALHSVLYDDWRHLYFVYAPFVLLIIYLLNKLFITKFRKIIYAIFIISFGFTIYFMVNNFPFQYVYFNCLADRKTPEHLRKNFDLDYWGISYKQAFEYILKNDSSPQISIACENSPGRKNLVILKKEDRERIRIADDADSAKYYITNYRWHPEDYPEREKYKWKTFTVLNSSVNTIFKLK